LDHPSAVGLGARLGTNTVRAKFAEIWSIPAPGRRLVKFNAATKLIFESAGSVAGD
jgi:hypothetical protein